MRSRLRVPSLASCALTAGALLVSSLASAQPEQPAAESVVLLAPPEVRAEWTAALQIELAARGAIAIPADLPEVATTLLGDAEAQRLAIERGASAAVWVEARPDAWRHRMLSASAERARVVPVARDADARTVALIVVSLLDGAAEPPVPDPSPAMQGVTVVVAAPEEPPSVGPGAAALAEPAAEVGGSEEEDEPALRGGEPYVHWAGLLGVSGFGFANDQRFDVGLTLRAGIGMRYDWFEVAILHDLGFYMEASQFNGPQPFGRACLDVGAATPRTAAAFHAGVRGCFGSVFALETQGGFGGPTVFISNGPRTHMSGGGYLAVSFELLSWLRIFVRADVDVGWTDLTLRDSIDLVPAVSSYLSFS